MDLKIGDAVLYCGVMGKLTSLQPRAVLDENGKPFVVNIAYVDNPKQMIKCRADELKHSAEDKAWYLPGMVLSHLDRDIYASAIGGGQRPRPENHFIARRLLGALTDDERQLHAAKVAAAKTALKGDN